MADKLHIDIETFSSIDLKTSGVYRYTESIDFEILLIAYALNNGQKLIIDMRETQSPYEGPFADFLKFYNDPKIEKHAHNAAFERLCFKAAGYDIPVSQWHCSAIKAAYCGLPLSLAGVSEALKLDEKGKSWKGKDLIRYFCIPCKPTKTNNGRTRNLPEHAPEKWQAFKEYCLQDVEAEREVLRKLEGYNVPRFERDNYILDQEINDRGIMIDEDFVETALLLDDLNSAELSEQLKKLTGLDNPNSPAQLKNWLTDAMKKPITTLAKDSLPVLIEEAGPGAAADVLRLRQRASKTSIKKYNAMQKCVCDDGRAHGLFQYYGAMRTGRWAGRLIQLQNLPRNYVHDLEIVREIVETGDYDFARLTIGNVSDILSQLIRTAFVARPGHTFGVADYSAIEARVIAWLAGEKWRVDVFETHGKIYEASAAAMFNTTVESIGKGSMERQAGKVAELALGYGGGANAIKTMGASIGLSDDLIDNIVRMDTVGKWRKASPAIVRFWKDVEASANRALKQRGSVITLRNLRFTYDGNFLTIELPSGRSLFYASPGIAPNKFGGEGMRYEGLDNKKWGYVETYGGKLVENIVQAVSRDILAFSMHNLDFEGYEIVMHVHDEAVCEIQDKNKNTEEQLKEMCDIMGRGPEWAKGLPLNADGYITPFYKKD